MPSTQADEPKTVAKIWAKIAEEAVYSVMQSALLIPVPFGGPNVPENEPKNLSRAN